MFCLTQRQHSRQRWRAADALCQSGEWRRSDLQVVGGARRLLVAMLLMLLLRPDWQVMVGKVTEVGGVWGASISQQQQLFTQTGSGRLHPWW